LFSSSESFDPTTEIFLSGGYFASQPSKKKELFSLMRRRIIWRMVGRKDKIDLQKLF
jgi:hypothetical protein